jgi:hypothetical protein
LRPNKYIPPQREIMKNVIRRMLQIGAAAVAIAAVSGCVVVPERPAYGYGYGYHHYWDR